MSGKGRSYFLHDLLTKVIFQEAGWVSRDVNAIRRSSAIRYGAITAMLLATAGLSGAWIWSYLQNKQLVDATNASIAEYRTKAGWRLTKMSSQMPICTMCSKSCTRCAIWRQAMKTVTRNRHGRRPLV